jgi:hypothetical protein
MSRPLAELLDCGFELIFFPSVSRKPRKIRSPAGAITSQLHRPAVQAMVGAIESGPGWASFEKATRKYSVYYVLQVVGSGYD